jgi:cell wall-associated NlpC family hydrolase
MIAPWANDYVGLPFEWNGYSRNGIGCYGLVALVQLEQFGIQMPRHDDVADLLADTGSASVPSVPNWVEIDIDHADAGDIMHMKGIHGGKVVPMHIGVFVSPQHVLHIEAEVGSCIVDRLNKRHAWRTIGAHRHA